MGPVVHESVEHRDLDVIAVGGAGAAVGVLLGGGLTSLIGWQAIFLVNVPIGVGAVAVLADFPRLRGQENVHKRYLVHIAGYNLGVLMRAAITISLASSNPVPPATAGPFSNNKELAG